MCLETADRTLGDQIHAYANVLAVGKGFSAPQNDIVNARNSAQTLANSLEILGDAQPTQANYDQVLNTFDVNGAIAQLRGDVQKLDGALGRLGHAARGARRPRRRRRGRADPGATTAPVPAPPLRPARPRHRRGPPRPTTA